jgi:hypothetical protein
MRHETLGLVRVVRDRVEAGAHERDQRRGDVGVGDERARGRSGAERGLGLAQPAADRAQQHHLAGVEAGGEHEAVERVVLALSLPDADERLLQALARELALQRRRARREAEVVDPCGGAVARLELVRALVGDAQPEVLEDRQHVRERDRPRRREQLAAQRLAAVLDRAVRAHGEPARSGRVLDAPQIGHRRAGRPVLAVARRERVAPALEALKPGLLAVLGDQRVAKVVAPGAGRPREARLDLGHRRLRGAGGRAEEEVDPHEDRLGEQRRPLVERRVQRLA